MEKKLIKFLEENNSAYTVEELAKALNMETSKNFVKLIKTIAKLEARNIIALDKDGRISLSVSENMTLTGTFRSNERGFGFVTVENMEDDIFISKDNTGTALNGDNVEVDILKPANPFKEQLAEGKIIKVNERKYKYITCLVESLNPTDEYVALAKPTDKKLSSYPVYLIENSVQVKKDEICQIEITNYPSKKHLNIIGVAVSVLGHKDAPGVDIQTIVESYEIPTKFPENVIEEANKVPDKIIEIEKYRKDLTDRQIVTIDGESAKDLDDAVEVKKLSNGHYYLGVHIADVSYYVTDKSALDKEAYERGTSVYLTDRVIPMLPRRLSNGICSLNPYERRNTLTCEMEIDENGKVVKYKIFPSTIISKARMTYTAVNNILDDESSHEREEYQDFVSMFEDMRDLHHILSKMRENRGAISFEDQEAVIKVDADGKPYDIELRERKTAEKMIESFMLAANETVAKHFYDQKLPFIYRIHEAPKSDKVQSFLDLMSILGIQVKGTKDDISSKELQKVLEKIEGKPEEAMVNTMLLRSMQQARYSDEPVGHYGLAAKDYTHFTSPIRRYPDLIVHRLIREEFFGSLDSKKQDSWNKRLKEIAEHSSKMERRAVDAERETDNMKKAEYMEQHIGEEFEGVISSVTNFGIFISLANTIEGLVHLSKLKDDYYEYHEKQMMLIGKRTGRIFKLGEKVKVKVTNANAETREIDFDLVLDEVATKKEIKVKHSKKNKKKIKRKNRFIKMH